MKKFFALFWVIMLVFSLVGCSAAKTQDEIVDMLRQELQLPKDDNSAISCAGEFVMGENALLWFTVQNEQMVYYRAVDCKAISNGKYTVQNISKPMTYAQDIVHTVWYGEDIFLINNPDCQVIVYKDKSGNEISRMEMSSKGIPYVFHYEPIDESSCDFLDTAGNVIK